MKATTSLIVVTPDEPPHLNPGAAAELLAILSEAHREVLSTQADAA
ncbi:hypothetical protein AB0K48_11725 [Nonomuraea sp. NPDC055795]